MTWERANEGISSWSCGSIKMNHAAILAFDNISIAKDVVGNGDVLIERGIQITNQTIYQIADPVSLSQQSIESKPGKDFRISSKTATSRHSYLRPETPIVGGLRAVRRHTIRTARSSVSKVNSAQEPPSRVRFHLQSHKPVCLDGSN